MYKRWVLNRRLSLLLWNSDIPRLDCTTRINVICRVHGGQSLKTVVTRRLQIISDQTVRNSIQQGGIRPRTSFHPGTQTCMCSLVSYIEGLDFEELALNLVRRWITFSSPKMWWMNPRVQPSKWPFTPDCIQEGGWYGDGSAMVWAEISNNRRTNLVRVQGNLTGQRYKDDILQQHILNVIDRQREIFQQDNARLHTARETMDFLTQNNINVLPWPSMSSDMNPKSWIELYRPVRQRQPPSQ